MSLPTALSSGALSRRELPHALVRRPADAARLAFLVLGIAAAVGARWATQDRLPGQGVLIGASFGVALLAMALASGWRPRADAIVRPTSVAPGVSIALGAAFGLALVALAGLTRTDAMPALRPVVAFLPWAGVTSLVATAEEAAVRGAIFGGLERVGGPLVALLATSLVFAFMHVPFYGWQAVPLDLGVGLVLGGLRLATGGIAAPVVAHALADLATWWL